MYIRRTIHPLALSDFCSPFPSQDSKNAFLAFAQSFLLLFAPPKSVRSSRATLPPREQERQTERTETMKARETENKDSREETRRKQNTAGHEAEVLSSRKTRAAKIDNGCMTCLFSKTGECQHSVQHSSGHGSVSSLRRYIYLQESALWPVHTTTHNLRHIPYSTRQAVQPCLSSVL